MGWYVCYDGAVQLHKSTKNHCTLKGGTVYSVHCTLYLNIKLRYFLAAIFYWNCVKPIDQLGGKWHLYYVEYFNSCPYMPLHLFTSSGFFFCFVCLFFTYIFVFVMSLVAHLMKNLPAVQKTSVQSLGWEDPREKWMATHFSILAWKISWTEEPGRLQSIGSQRVGHNWVTNTYLLIRFTLRFFFYHL